MSVDLEFDYEATTSTLEFYSESDIQELQHWIQKLDKSKCVPKNLSNKQLVLFYNACEGNMEETRICIKKYYNYRRKAPEFFNNRTFKVGDLKSTEHVYEFSLLPEKSVEGYEVLCYSLHDTDYKNYTFESFSKLFFMTTDLSLYKRGPQSGYIFIIDMQRAQLGHVLKINPITLRKLLLFVQEALLLPVKTVHIINATTLLDKVMLLSKPFLSKDLYHKIKVHNKAESLENLMEFIPKSGLPSDLGGSLPDRQTLHKQNIEQLKSLEAYFRDEENQRRVAIPEEKLKKSFDKLEID